VKIAKVETIRPLDHPNVLWILLHDDQGNVGLGETFFGQTVIEEYVHTSAAPILLGLKSALPEIAHLALTPYTGFQGGGVEQRTLGGIDIGLWDLWGKRTNLPVVDLLGGGVRDDIKIYNTCAGPDYVRKTTSQHTKNWGLKGAADSSKWEDLTAFFERPAELARDLFDSGIKGMKIWPFDPAAEATNGAYISQEDLSKTLKIFEKIRNEVGMEMDLMVELHGLWQRTPVEMIMHGLAEFNPYWIEDPIRPDAIDAISFLRESTGLRIATGETVVGRRGVLPLLQKNAVDILTIDTQWTGGLTEARKVATLADTYATAIAPHDCTGPVSLAACTHLVLSQKNGIIQETVRAFLNTWYSDFTTGMPPIKDGRISVTRDPGHGVLLNPELLKSDRIVRRESVA
jgi:L-alanine-DL-glutamate epimerase-like enolase superfamily enzyme